MLIHQTIGFCTVFFVSGVARLIFIPITSVYRIPICPNPLALAFLTSSINEIQMMAKRKTGRQTDRQTERSNYVEMNV